MYNKCNQSGKKKYTNLKAHTEIRIHKLESTCSKCSSVICCGQHFFPVPFWGKILRYRIIVVITSKPIRKITLIFVLFRGFSKVTHSAIKTLNSKEVESGNCILQNHCSHNAKANSKDNSENALLCSLLRQSTDFFSWLSKLTHSAIKTCNSKEVESGNGILQDQCHDNVEANSKDNTLSLQNIWNDLRLFPR